MGNVRYIYPIKKFINLFQFRNNLTLSLNPNLILNPNPNTSWVNNKNGVEGSLSVMCALCALQIQI